MVDVETRSKIHTKNTQLSICQYFEKKCQFKTLIQKIITLQYTVQSNPNQMIKLKK